MKRSPDAETALLRLHADVLFRIDRNDRLLGVNEEPMEDPAPLLFLAKGRTAHLICFRTDVSGSTIRACTEVAQNLPTWDGRESAPAIYKPFQAVLRAQSPISGSALRLLSTECQRAHRRLGIRHRGDAVRLEGARRRREPDPHGRAR